LEEYIEHVLHLPLAQQTKTHSGRLMKIMLQGTDALWWLWLSFFREHLAAIVSLIILIPIALYINWRLALVLIALCLVFSFLTHFVLRKTHVLQRQIEGHHSDLAELTSDTLSNIALIQSFSRIQIELNSLHQISQRVLMAQFPVLSWWALVTVLCRTAITISILCIIVLGVWLFIQSLITIGEIVTFVAFAGIIFSRLEQVVGFANKLSADAPRLKEFFDDFNKMIFLSTQLQILNHIIQCQSRILPLSIPDQREHRSYTAPEFLPSIIGHMYQDTRSSLHLIYLKALAKFRMLNDGHWINSFRHTRHISLIIGPSQFNTPT
jgi:ABC-type multidrug transport system fused ATPase/permease subunit